MNIREHYDIVKQLANNRFLVMSKADDKICLLKILKMYELSVFLYLKNNTNPHIPKVFELYESDGLLYVFEEYIEGKTLDEMIREGYLTDNDRKKILLQICDGLDFLHKANRPIIHRDLKPQNIMITGNGFVKIVDYDAAKTYKEGQSRDTVLLGTYDYAAPEQYGFSQSDPRTDIYALGRIIENMFPSSKRLLRVARKACAMDPNARYGNIRQVRRAIDSPLAALWPPVGFRQKKWWHIVIACHYYLLMMFLFIFISQDRTWMWWKHILYRVETLAIFLFPADIFFNWTGIFLDFPIPKVRRKSKVMFVVLGIVYFFILFGIIRIINHPIPYG